MINKDVIMEIIINQTTTTVNSINPQPTPAQKSTETQTSQAPTTSSKGKLYTKDSPTITPITPSPGMEKRELLDTIATMLAAVEAMEITVAKTIVEEDKIEDKMDSDAKAANEASNQSAVDKANQDEKDYENQIRDIICEFLPLLIILPPVGLLLAIVAIDNLKKPVEPAITPYIKPVDKKKQKEEAMLIVLMAIEELLKGLMKEISQVKKPDSSEPKKPIENQADAIKKLLSIIDKVLLLISKDLTPELKKPVEHSKLTHQELSA
jgi:predicted  nucleic acid-binding Zn-ribbon protein